MKVCGTTQLEPDSCKSFFDWVLCIADRVLCSYRVLFPFSMTTRFFLVLCQEHSLVLWLLVWHHPQSMLYLTCSKLAKIHHSILVLRFYLSWFKWLLYIIVFIMDCLLDLYSYICKLLFVFSGLSQSLSEVFCSYMESFTLCGFSSVTVVFYYT